MVQRLARSVSSGETFKYGEIMDDIQNLDIDKIARISQRYGQNSVLHSVVGIFASIFLIVMMIWQESIAKSFGLSPDTIALIACVPTGIYLLWFGLSWRKWQQDYFAATNTMWEIEMQ